MIQSRPGLTYRLDPGSRIEHGLPCRCWTPPAASAQNTVTPEAAILTGTVSDGGTIPLRRVEGAVC